MKKVRKLLASLLCAAMIITGSIPVMAAEQTTSVQTPTYVAPKIDVVTLINYYIQHLDVDGYKKKNPDLVTVFGNDVPTYILHYVLCGIPEGRATATWDPVAYVVNNGDKIGQSILEGKSDFFNIAKYKAAYPQLEALYGADGSQYLAHYLTEGILAGEISGGTFDPVTFAKKYPNAAVRTNVVPTDFAKAVKAEQNKPAAVSAVSSSSGGSATSTSNSTSSSSSSSGGSSSGSTSKPVNETITKIAFKMQQNDSEKAYEIEIPDTGLEFKNENDLYFKELWLDLYSDYQVNLVTYVGDKVEDTYPLTYTDFTIENAIYTATLKLDKYFFKKDVKFASTVPSKLIITYEPDEIVAEEGVVDNYAICMVMEDASENTTVKITNHPIQVTDKSLTTFQKIWDDMTKMGSMYIVAYSGTTELKRIAVQMSDFTVDDENGVATLKLGKDLFGSEAKINEKAPKTLTFDYATVTELDEFKLYYELDKNTGEVYEYPIADLFDLTDLKYKSFEELYNEVLKDSLFIRCYSDGVLQETIPLLLDDFVIEAEKGYAACDVANKLTDGYAVAEGVDTRLAVQYIYPGAEEDGEFNEYGDYKDSTYSNKFVYPTIEFTDLGLSYTLPVKLTDLLADGWCMGTVPMQDIRTSAGDEKEYSLYHPDLQYSDGKGKPAWRILSTKNTTLSDAYVTGITLYPGYDKFSINGYTFEKEDTVATISEKLKANSAKPGKYYYSVSDLKSNSQNRDSSSMEFTYFDGLSSIQIIGHYNKAISVDEESKAVEASQKSLYEDMKATYDDYELQLGMTLGQVVKVFGTTITNDKNIKAGKTLNEKVPIADGVNIYLEFKNFSDNEVPVSECRLIYMESILTGGLDAVPYENSLFFKDFKANKTSYTDTSKVLGKIENLEFWKSESQWSASWTDTDGYKIFITYVDAENKIRSWHLQYTGDTADQQWPDDEEGEKLITGIQAYKTDGNAKENISLTETYTTEEDITVSAAWEKFLGGKTAGVTFTFADGTSKDVSLDIAKMSVDESTRTATVNFDESFFGEGNTLSDSLGTKFTFTVDYNQPTITKLTAMIGDSDISLTPTFETTDKKNDVEEYWDAYLNEQTVKIVATLSNGSTKEYPLTFNDMTVDEDQLTATINLDESFFGSAYQLSSEMHKTFIFTVSYSKKVIDSLAFHGGQVQSDKKTGEIVVDVTIQANEGEDFDLYRSIDQAGYYVTGYVGDKTVDIGVTSRNFRNSHIVDGCTITAEDFGNGYTFAEGLSMTIHVTKVTSKSE